MLEWTIPLSTDIRVPRSVWFQGRPPGYLHGSKEEEERKEKVISRKGEGGGLYQGEDKPRREGGGPAGRGGEMEGGGHGRRRVVGKGGTENKFCLSQQGPTLASNLESASLEGWRRSRRSRTWPAHPSTQQAPGSLKCCPTVPTIK